MQIDNFMLNSKKYTIDLNRLFEFVFDEGYSRITDSEIVETYIEDDETKNLVLANKQLRELKAGDNSSKQAIRYDMVKLFVDLLMSIDLDEGIEALSFGEILIINTLLSQGILVEIKE